MEKRKLNNEEIQEIRNTMKRPGFKLFMEILADYEEKEKENLIAADDVREADKIRGKINILRTIDKLVGHRIKSYNKKNSDNTINL
ncbi:MAG: hypothetical protein K9L56_14235 [Clostridiales bacterium]|nr:hypothetical protein [Clostridiales bacterium]